MHSQPRTCARSLSPKERGLAGTLHYRFKSCPLHLGLFPAPQNCLTGNRDSPQTWTPAGSQFLTALQQHQEFLHCSHRIRIPISNQTGYTHARLKRRRHLHISLGFDRFLVIYSATCKCTESIPDGYLLNANVNRSVWIRLNIYIKETIFFFLLHTQEEKPKL